MLIDNLIIIATAPVDWSMSAGPVWLATGFFVFSVCAFGMFASTK